MLYSFKSYLNDSKAGYLSSETVRELWTPAKAANVGNGISYGNQSDTNFI